LKQKPPQEQKPNLPEDVVSTINRFISLKEKYCQDYSNLEAGRDEMVPKLERKAKLVDALEINRLKIKDMHVRLKKLEQDNVRLQKKISATTLDEQSFQAIEVAGNESLQDNYTTLCVMQNWLSEKLKDVSPDSFPSNLLDAIASYKTSAEIAGVSVSATTLKSNREEVAKLRTEIRLGNGKKAEGAEGAAMELANDMDVDVPEVPAPASVVVVKNHPLFISSTGENLDEPTSICMQWNLWKVLLLTVV
jgi:hypothetical protein